MCLSKHFLEDIPDAHRVFDLVETIRGVRFNKMQRGLRKIDAATIVKLNNLAAMEVASLPSFSLFPCHVCSLLPL